MDKGTNRIVGLVFIIFLVIGLTSCGSSGSGGGGEIQSDGPKTFDELAAMVKKMDVSGAQGFVLTGNKGTAMTASRTAGTALAKAAGDAITLEENSIYKVTDDGRLERVPITDDKGNELTRGTVHPLSVRDLDSLYAVFWFRIVAYGEVVPYLVHKPTGLAYRASGVIPEDFTENRFGANLYRINKNFPYDRDAAGNLYIENRNGTHVKLFKIDGSGLGSGALKARELNISGELDGSGWEKNWTIDANGTFLVYVGVTVDGGVVRFLDIASGALTNLASLGLLPTGDPYWYRGSDGKVYTIKWDGNQCDCTEVLRIERGTDGRPIVTTIGPLSSTSTTGESIYGGTVWPQDFDRYIIGGKEIIFDVDTGITFEVFPDQAKVIVHDLPNKELSSLNNIHFSDNFIFYFGKSKTTLADIILRYDPVTLTATTFDLGDNFDMDLNHVKVLNYDTIWFEALRLSDQAKVIGKMDSDGTVTILDVIAADEPQIIIMEAIHPTDFLVINGDMQEWSLDKRVQQDIAGDAASGDDLRYYSQQKSKTNYFGLVEFEGDEVSSDSISRITIDNTYQIRIGSSLSEFRNLLDDTSSVLRNIGGIAASVPLAALSGAAFTDINVSRVAEGIFGDVSTITPVKNGTDWTLTIGMATPIGDATVEIALTDGYVLRFDKTGAVLDDGVTRSNLTDAGGSITYPVTDGGDITVVIPEAVISSPATLSPTEQSSGEIFDVVIDFMGN